MSKKPNKYRDNSEKSYYLSSISQADYLINNAGSGLWFKNLRRDVKPDFSNLNITSPENTFGNDNPTVYAQSQNPIGCSSSYVDFDVNSIMDCSEEKVGAIYEEQFATTSNDYKLAIEHEEVANQYWSEGEISSSDDLNYIDVLNEALEFMKSTKWEKAIQIYEELLDTKRLERYLNKFPNEYYFDILCRYEIFNNLGICFIKRQQKDEALESFCKAMVYESITVMQDFTRYPDIDDFDARYAKALTSWNNIKMLLPQRLDKENPFQYIANNEHCYFLCRYLINRFKVLDDRLFNHILPIVIFNQFGIYNNFRVMGKEQPKLKDILDKEFGMFDRSVAKKVQALIGKKDQLYKVLNNLVGVIKDNVIRGNELEVAECIYNDLYEDMLLAD